jgi:hypothetical protein
MGALVVPITALGQVDKVTICHAAGPEEPNQFVTLELPAPAVYGNGGHFHENGTARAGHEDDYLGPCTDDSTPTSESPDTTAGEEETTSTTESPGTTLTDEEESTTSTAPADPADDEIGSTVETTTTTTVAAVVPADAPDGDDGNSDGGDNPVIASTPDSAPEAVAADDTTEGSAAGATLPFTGPSTTLVYPASLLVLAGLMAVFVTRGFGAGSGAHVAVDRDRFGLGLHRGRHETSRTSF